MAAGSTLAAVLLVAWSRVDHIVPFYAVWFGLGIAMACVLYEPAFAAVATWFPTGRTRALTTLTFVAGFASIVFVPLAAWLVERQGWRDALVTLAAIVLIGTALPHALFLRRAPVATAAANRGISTRHALQSPEFRAIAVSFALATFASMAVFVHVLPFMVDRGYSATYASTVTAPSA